MIAFHPNHLNASLGIGKLANVGEKAPVVFLETSEIEVAEDIAQQNQAAEAVLPQHFDCIARAAETRAQVKIGKNDGIG